MDDEAGLHTAVKTAGPGVTTLEDWRHFSQNAKKNLPGSHEAKRTFIKDELQPVLDAPTTAAMEDELRRRKPTWPAPFCRWLGRRGPGGLTPEQRMIRMRRAIGRTRS